jgi:polyisoprenoid-binding protein YceI
MNRFAVIVLFAAVEAFAAKPKPAPKIARDAGVADAGAAIDAGTPDAGVRDAGVIDAGAVTAPKLEKLALIVEEVLFHSTTPMSSIDGRTKSMEALAEGDFITLSVPLDTVDTGIGLRNSHMRKYLEATQFPTAELKVRRALLKEGARQEGVGTFTVHGVAKEVKVTFDVVKTAAGLTVTGSFPLNLKDHGIAVPTYLGITVRPDIKVTATFTVKN